MQSTFPAAAMSSDSLVPKKRTPYIKTGLGGAGNFRPRPDSLQPSTKTTRPRLTSMGSSGRFSTGRGGVGNCRESNNRPYFAREEEDLRARVRDDHAPTSFYHGRGGYGNRTVKYLSRDSTDTLSSARSYQSGQSSTSSVSRSRFSRLMAHFRDLY